MKSLVLMLCVAVCIANGCSTDEPGLSGPDNCLSDSCLCPDTETCDHACSPGGVPCRVVCSRGLDCNVICDPNEPCGVEASQAAEVNVDCRNSVDCRVVCPATGCTVVNCTGNCGVVCGLFDLATHHGSTATCP